MRPLDWPTDEYVIRGARLLQHGRDPQGPFDIVIRGSAIAEVVGDGDAQGLPGIEVDGGIVSPGLIDLHGHWYQGSSFGIDPSVCLDSGVTTACDAGSTGYVNFDTFKEGTIDRAPLHLLAWLHVSALGLATTLVGELQDIRLASPADAVITAKRNSDVIIGIKVRLDSWAAGGNIAAAFQAALEAAIEADLPLMVHIGPGVDVDSVAPSLRSGDVITHAYTGSAYGLLLDGSHEQLPAVLEARARGVRIDTGPGCGSFSWRVARLAMSAGVMPDSISTDLHRYSISTGVVDLPTTLTKFMHLGMSVSDVVECATSAPASILGSRAPVTEIRAGSTADLAILRMEEGHFPVVDAEGVTEVATSRIVATHTIVGGRAYQAEYGKAQLRPLYVSDAHVKCGSPVT